MHEKKISKKKKKCCTKERNIFKFSCKFTSLDHIYIYILFPHPTFTFFILLSFFESVMRSGNGEYVKIFFVILQLVYH